MFAQKDPIYGSIYSEYSILKQKNAHFFKYTHNIFRIDHILGHITSLNKFKKIEIIPCIFSNHNATKLETNHKKHSGRSTSTWRLNDMLLNNEWINREIKEEIQKYVETNENKNIIVQNLWNAAKAVLRG